VQTLSEKMLASIGRMTVAAADLEYLLAEIAAERGGAVAFVRPGDALAAARDAVAASAGLVRAVEAAGTQLAIGDAALRRLWHDDANAADPAAFDAVAGQLVRCRAWLRDVVDDHLACRSGVT
jgi:hypothetical protein